MGAYPSVADRYVLLPHGASMGFGYGPIVVAREPLDPEELRELEIVIPGRRHDRLPHAPARARRRPAGARAAVRPDPRRGRLRPRRGRPADPRGAAHLRPGGAPQGARRRGVVAGGDGPAASARRQRRPARSRRRASPTVSAVLSEAIRVGLEHRDEALVYAQRYGRGIDEETTDRFVAMYVNELTCDYGERRPPRGRRAPAALRHRRHSRLRLNASLRASRYRWAVLAAGTFAQTGYASIPTAVAVLAPSLRSRYHLTLTEVGRAARRADRRVDPVALPVGYRGRPVRRARRGRDRSRRGGDLPRRRGLRLVVRRRSSSCSSSPGPSGRPSTRRPGAP